MYKLVSVVVDSDAYEKTYEFRAIVICYFRGVVGIA